MSHQPVIDGLEFARAAARLQGTWPVAEFLRLHDALRSTAGTLRYELRGVPEEHGRPVLRLKVDGALQLTPALPDALEFALQLGLCCGWRRHEEMDAEPLQADGRKHRRGQKCRCRLVEMKCCWRFHRAAASCAGGGSESETDVVRGCGA
jgi:hypothetical protein